MNKGAFDEIKLRFSKKDMSFIPKDGKKRRRLLLILAAVIVGAYIVFSSVYMVNDQEKAVITTFGQVTGTADAFQAAVRDSGRAYRRGQRHKAH